MSSKKSGKARRIGSTRKDLRGLGSQMRDKEADVFTTLLEESRTVEHESATTGGEPKPIEEQSRPMGEESWTTGGEPKLMEERSRPMSEESRTTGEEPKSTEEESVAIGVASWSMERNSRTTGEKQEVDYKPEESSLSEKTASLLALAPSHDPYSAGTPHLESNKMEKKKRMGSTRRKLPTDLEEHRREGWEGAEQEEWQGGGKHAVDDQAGSTTAQPLGELYTEPQKASECLEGREESTITGKQHAIHMLDMSAILNKSADSQFYPQSMYSEEAQKNKQLHITNESNSIINLDQSEGKLTDEDTYDRDLLQSTDSGQLGHVDAALQLPKSERSTQHEDSKHEMAHFEHKNRKMGSTRKGGRALQIKSDREQEIDILPEEMLRNPGDPEDVCVLQGKESQEESRLDVIQYMNMEEVKKEGLLQMEESKEAEALTGTDRDKEQEKHKSTRETNEKYTTSGLLGTDMVDNRETQEATATDIVEDISVDMEGREIDSLRGTGIAEENMKAEVRETDVVTEIRAPGLGGSGMADRETEETTGTRILEFNETHRLRETHILEDNVAQENQGTDGGQRDEAEKESVTDVILEVNVMKYEGASNKKESTKEEEGDGAQAKKTGKNWRQTQVMQIDLNMLDSFYSEKYEQEVTASERERNSPLENPSVESFSFQDESKTFIPEEQVKFTPFEDLLEPCKNSPFYNSTHMEAPSTEDENKQNFIVPQEWEHVGKKIKTESTHGNATENKMENRSKGAGDDRSELEEIRAEKIDVKLEIEEKEPEVNMAGGIKENKWKLAEERDIKMKGTNIGMEESVADSQEFSKTETTDCNKDDSSYIYDPFHNVSVDPIVTERTTSNTLSLEMNQKSDESSQKESPRMPKRKKMGSSRKGGRGLHKETEKSTGFSNIDGLEVSEQQGEREEKKATEVKQNVINVVMEMTKEETKISMAEVTSKSEQKVKITNDNSGAEDFESQQNVTVDPTATEKLATNVVKGFEQHEDYSDRASSRSEKRRKIGTSHRRGRERLKEKEIQEMAETEVETMAMDNKESATDEVMKSVQNEDREHGNEKAERKSGSGGDKSLTSMGVIPNLQRPENSAISTQQECSGSQDTFLPAARRRKMGSTRQGQDNLRKRDVGLGRPEGCTAEAHINTAALLQRIQEVFHQPDVEEKGCITWENVQGLNHELGLSIEELHQVFQQLDGDQDGLVTHRDLTESLESCKQEQYFQFKREYSGTHSLGTSGVQGKADFGVRPSINEKLLTGSGLGQADPHLREGQALWEKKGTQARSEDTGSISKTQESEEAWEKEEETDEAGSKEQEREMAGEKEEETDEAGSKEQEREEAGEKEEETDEAGSKEQEREEAESWHKKNESQNAESKSENYKAEKEELLSTGHELKDTHLMHVEGELLNKDQERKDTQFLNQEQQNEWSKELDEEQVSDEAERLKKCQGSKEAEIMNENQDSGKAGLLHKDRDIERAELANKNQDNDHIMVLNENEENIMVELLIKNQGSKQEELLSKEEKGVEAEFLSEELDNKEQGNQDTYCEEVEPLNEHGESLVKDSPNPNRDMEMTINLSGETTHEKEIVMSVKQLVDNASSIQEERKQNGVGAELLSKDQQNRMAELLSMYQESGEAKMMCKEQGKEEREIPSRYHGAVQAGIMAMTQNNNEEGMVSKDQASGEAEILTQDQECLEVKLLNKDEDNDITEIMSEDQVREETDLLGCDMESQLLSKQQQGEEARILNQCQKGVEVQLLYDDQYDKETEVLGKYNETVAANIMNMTQNDKDQTTEEAEVLNQNKQIVEVHILNGSQNVNDLENLGQDRKKTDLLNKHIESDLQVMHKDSEEAEILNKHQDHDEAVIINLVQESEEAEILDKDQDNEELEESEVTERLQDKDNEEADILKKHQEGDEFDSLNTDRDDEEAEIEERYLQSEEARIIPKDQEYVEIEMLDVDQHNEEIQLDKQLESEGAEILNEEQETVEVYIQHEDQNSNDAENLGKYLEREKANITNKDKQREVTGLVSTDTLGEETEILKKDQGIEEAVSLIQAQRSEEAAILIQDQESEEAEVMNTGQDSAEVYLLNKDWNSNEVQIQSNNKEGEEAEILSKQQEGEDMGVLDEEQDGEEIVIPDRDLKNEEAVIINPGQDFYEAELLNMDQMSEKLEIINQDQEGEEAEMLDQDQDSEEQDIVDKGPESEETDRLKYDEEHGEVELLNKDQDNEEAEFLGQKNKEAEIHKDRVREETDLVSIDMETEVQFKDKENEDAEILNDKQECVEVELLNKDQNNEKAEILKKHQEGDEFEALNRDKDGEEAEIEVRYLESEEAMIIPKDQEYVEVMMLDMDQDNEEIQLDKELESVGAEILNEEQETVEVYIQHEDQNSNDAENLGKYLEREKANITYKDKQREVTGLVSADTLGEETEILKKDQGIEEAESLIQAQRSEEAAILIQDQESEEAEVMNTGQDSAEVYLLNKDWNSNEVQIQSNNKEGEEAEILSKQQEGEDMGVLDEEQDGEEIVIPDRDLKNEEAVIINPGQDFYEAELLEVRYLQSEEAMIIPKDQQHVEVMMLDMDQDNEDIQLDKKLDRNQKHVGIELPCTLQYRYKTHLRDAFDDLREVEGPENEYDPHTSRAVVEDNEWIWDCDLLKEQQFYSGCNEKESWDVWDETNEAGLGSTVYREVSELGSEIDNAIYWKQWRKEKFGRNKDTSQILDNDLYPIPEENETENNIEYNNVEITEEIAKIQEMPQATDQGNTIIDFIIDNHELKEIQEKKCILSEGNVTESDEQWNKVRLIELREKTEDVNTFENNKGHQDIEPIEGATGNTMENRQCPATLANAVNQKDSNELSECVILDGEKQEANAIKQSHDSVLVRSDVLGGANKDSIWVPEILTNDDETICTGMATQTDSIVREMGEMRGRQAMAETAEGPEVIQNAEFQMDGDRIQMQGSCEKGMDHVIEHLQLSVESDTEWDGGTSQGGDTIAMEMKYKEKTERQNNYEGAGFKKLSEVTTQEETEHRGGTTGQHKGDGKNWDTFEGGLAQGDIALKLSEKESLHTDRGLEDYNNDCPHEKWGETPVFIQCHGLDLELKTERLHVGPAQGTIKAKETEVGQQKDKGSDLIEREQASTGFSEDSESLIEKLSCDMNVMEWELLAEQGEKDNERRDEVCKDNKQLLTELVEYGKRGSDMTGVDDTSRSSNKGGVSLIQHMNSEDKDKQGVTKREQGAERYRMTPEEVCGEEELRMEAIRIYEEAEKEMSGDVMDEREVEAKEQKNREDKGKEGFRAMGGGIVVTPEDNGQLAIGCLPTGSWSPPISGPDLLYNIVLVGSSSVGKTSFMKRIQSGDFTLDHCATIGLDSCIQSLVVDGRRVLLQLWDTAGQERYHSITKQILRKAQGLLLMYDITCIDSFNSVQYWMSCIQEGATDDVIIMLLGNKNDSFKREVPLHEGERLAKEYRIKFMECSVATGENVTLSMETLARILKQQTDQKEEAPLILRKEQPKKKSGCC